MSGMLEKKRQALEALLQEMKSLRDAVQDGCFDGLDELSIRREGVVEAICCLDREHEKDGDSINCSRDEVEDLKALLAQIVDITDEVTASLRKQAAIIQNELGALHRGAEAAEGYRRQSNAKV